jgi:NADPH-dependent 2,4-dienoyl-CoA reductase/sulfur reductase-like enzyme
MPPGSASASSSAACVEVRRATSAIVRFGAAVFEAIRERDAWRLLVDTEKGLLTVGARSLVLATGARELFLPFPGWTLPGVLTAGGAQTLVKTQRVLPGRRIVFAGSGPLALAFPAQLRGYGANVTTVLAASVIGSVPPTWRMIPPSCTSPDSTGLKNTTLAP